MSGILASVTLLLCALVGFELVREIARQHYSAKAAGVAIELEMHSRFPTGSAVNLRAYGAVEVVSLWPVLRQVIIRRKGDKFRTITLSWDAFLGLVDE